MEKTDVHALIASYFDVGWEPYESDPKVNEIITEMKKLSDIYLKAKNSKSGDHMVASLAMEAELKRLKAELIEAVDAASEASGTVGESTVVENIDLGEPEDAGAEVAEEISEESDEANIEEDEEEETPQPKARLVKESGAKKDKFSMIALGLSVIALLASGAVLFLSSDNVTKLQFEEYKSGAHSTVMKDVTEATQSVRDELDTFKKDAEAIRIDVAALRAEAGANKQELLDKLQAQSDELGVRIAALQSTLKKAPAKKPAPLAKPLAKPSAVKKAVVPARTTTPKRR